MEHFEKKMEHFEKKMEHFEKKMEHFEKNPGPAKPELWESPLWKTLPI